MIPVDAKRKVANIILRIGVHSTCLMPFRMSLFFLGLGALQHRSVKGGVDKWRECFADGYKNAICFWPFVMIGLYTVVPVRWGNLYFDSFNLIFFVILSFIANRSSTFDRTTSSPLKLNPTVAQVQ